MSAQTMAQLKALSLHGMAASFTEVAAQARHTEFNPESFMQQLINGESAHRVVRSTAYQMGAARFPAHRDLAGFEFEQANVDEVLVRKLHSTEFTGSAHNAVLIGGPGTGKPTWPQLLACRPSRSMANGCVSSRRWNWSTPWSRRRQTARRARSL